VGLPSPEDPLDDAPDGHRGALGAQTSTAIAMSHALLARKPSFRRLWLAGLLSDTGSEVSRIGLVLYVFGSSGSVPMLALLVVLKTLPGVLVAPFAGVLADRMNRGRAMIASDLARMLFMLVVLVHPNLVMIYVAAALDSLAGALFEPARCAAVPQVVSHDEVLRANGLVRGAANITMIVGPVLGAELFLHTGLTITLLIDAGSFLASALLIAAAAVPDIPSTRAAAEPASGSARAGWRYLARHAVALEIVGLSFISMLCGGLWVPLAPFFIRDFLGGSERVLGWQLAAFGLGGVMGGLVALRVDGRVRTGPLLFMALLAEGVQISLYALVPQVAVSLVVLVLWGISVALIGASANAILQRHVDEHFLGRVFSVLRQGENLAMLLAMCVAVALSNRLASQTIFLLAGGCYCVAVTVASFTRGGYALRRMA
jgi:MFS family permease